jgi:long-chain-acyl-CoA dehydrogenase
MLDTNGRVAYTGDHETFRREVRKFLEREFIPNFDRWEREGCIERSFWLACGRAGLLCPTVPEAYGGLGLDFRYNAVIDEELGYLGAMPGTGLQSDVTAGYFLNYGSEEQKQRYLPKMISGEFVTAIAMTEPGAGSDLQGIRTTARRDGSDYIVNGSKIYITNGQTADLVIVVAKTEPDRAARGMSLILVEADRSGFMRGRNLDKVGQFSADTSELFFQDVRVPVRNCLGQENAGFGYLMGQLAQERLSIAVSGQAAAQRAFDEATAYVKERKAFGKTLLDFQNTRFVLADMKAKLQAGWAHLDWALLRHVEGQVDAGRGGGREILAHRNTMADRRRRAAALRRRRLYERIHHRQALAGRARSAHLWRNFGDHAGSHRPCGIDRKHLNVERIEYDGNGTRSVGGGGRHDPLQQAGTKRRV